MLTKGLILRRHHRGLAPGTSPNALDKLEPTATSLEWLLQKPFLRTRISHSKREISRKRLIVLHYVSRMPFRKGITITDRVSTTVVVMLKTEIMKIAAA